MLGSHTFLGAFSCVILSIRINLIAKHWAWSILSINAICVWFRAYVSQADLTYASFLAVRWICSAYQRLESSGWNNSAAVRLRVWQESFMWTLSWHPNWQGSGVCLLQIQFAKIECMIYLHFEWNSCSFSLCQPASITSRRGVRVSNFIRRFVVN